MPYGYDVANAQIPQAANPIDSIAKGLTSGIDLGLGLQRERQQYQLNQLRQQAEQQQMKLRNYEAGFKALSVLGNKDIRDNLSDDTYEKLLKTSVPWINKNIGTNLSPDEISINSMSKADTNRIINLIQKSIDPSTGKLSHPEVIRNEIALEKLKSTKPQLQLLESVEKSIFPSQPNSSFLFAGTDNEGNLIGLNNKTFETKIVPSPSKGPLLPKNMTDTMANSSLYATRAEDANKQLDGLIQKGFDPTSLSSGVQKLLPNYFQGENAQALEQIGRNFGAAVLRKESGAAITKDEWDQVKLQYIPQPGDKPETLAQKALNRERAIQGLGQMGAKLPELSNSLIKSFKSEKEAESANLPSGTIIEINGRKARVK